MNPISFRPQQSCKKDYAINIDNQFEQYKSSRENNLDTSSDSKKETEKETKQPSKEYKKEDFIDKFNELHEDVYFNPYKILDIDKKYEPELLKTKYKEKALIYHPDRPTGDIDILKI